MTDFIKPILKSEIKSVSDLLLMQPHKVHEFKAIFYTEKSLYRQGKTKKNSKLCIVEKQCT